MSADSACHPEVHAPIENAMGKNLIRHLFDETIAEFGLDSRASTHMHDDISMLLPYSLASVTNGGEGGIVDIS